jgi:hypothetical protein
MVEDDLLYIFISSVIWTRSVIQAPPSSDEYDLLDKAPTPAFIPAPLSK